MYQLLLVYLEADLPIIDTNGVLVLGQRTY